MRKIIKNKNLVPVTIADLNLDDSPDLNSTDPVTSRGIASAITEAVGGASDALQQQIDDIAEKAGSGYTTKGPASVATLNGLTGQENGWLYTLTDAGTLTDGSLAVTAGDTVAWDATNSVWYNAMDYAPRQYGTNEIANLPNTATESDIVSGKYFVIDGKKLDAEVLLDHIRQKTLLGINGLIASVPYNPDAHVYIGGIDDNGNPEDWNNARVGRYNDYSRVEINSSVYEIRPSYYTSNSSPWSTDFVCSGLWGKNCFNDGTLFMAITIRRIDGSQIQESEFPTVEASLSFYKNVDTGLNISGVPADSKECGDRFNNVNMKLSNIGKDETLTVTQVDSGKQVNYSDGQVISSTPANISCKFEINYPAVLFVSGRIGTDNTMCGIAFYDSNNVFITALKKSNGTAEVFSNYLVVVPKGAKYLRVQGHTNYMPTPVVREITGLFVSNRTFYSGKKFSVLGDSISAYTGHIPVGNAPYYTGSNAGVTSYYQMWWKIACDLLDMDPLVINGWSGSCVTDGVRPDTTCASDISRCQELDDGVNNPDVIVVAMGVNDYSYNASIGTWDGRSDAASNSNFTEAYAYMLKKIISKYPNAEILCLAPWFMQRGTDNGTTYTNTLGLCARDYADASRKVCEIMGVKWFNADSIGFNRDNYYPAYCVDNPTNPTHPNMEGQKLMGVCVARALSNLVSKLI